MRNDMQVQSKRHTRSGRSEKRSAFIYADNSTDKTGKKKRNDDARRRGLWSCASEGSNSE